MRLSSHSLYLSVTTAFMVACLFSPAVADDVFAQAASPDSTLSVKIYVNPEGKLAYGVERKGQPVRRMNSVGQPAASASPWIETNVSVILRRVTGPRRSSTRFASARAWQLPTQGT